MKGKYNELNFQLMIDASPIAMVLVNCLGKIVYINKYSESLFSFNRNEVVGKNVQILLPERFHSYYSRFMKDYFTRPESRNVGKIYDLYANKKNGYEFPVEIGLNPVVTDDGTLVLVTIIDITERKKASELFRVVVESAPNAMVLVDHTGNIVMINAQTELLFGYKRDELAGKKVEILVPGKLQKYHQELRENFFTEFQSRPMGAGRDLYGVRKDGSEVPVEIGLNSLEKDNERFVLVSIIDISERKKHEVDLRLHTKKIEDKNKELEQFTYIASHDLREPLNSITSLIDILVVDEKNNQNRETLKRLNFIVKSSNRMKELVKGLLDYARLGKNSEFEQIDLNKIILNVVNDLGLSIKDSETKIKLGKLPVLYALELEIHLLFQNLISNAIKYRSPERKSEIEISAKKVKGGWRFAVSDNGIGIPSNQKEKIFIIFQRLHGRDEYGGIGIGLSHCRKIVEELHNGKLWVESELGNGSTFYFFLPLK